MVSLRISVHSIMIGESTASQLPGRDFGPADAYRHVLLAAELTRVYGANVAMGLLVDHEMERDSAADNGMDFWNNDIGIQIGLHVAANGGGWHDVVRLAREAMTASFSGYRYDQIPAEWKTHEPEEGIQLAYEPLREMASEQIGYGLLFSELYGASFEDFAAQFNQTFRFRTTGAEAIHLDGGGLEVRPIAITSPQFWEKHPVVDGRRLTVEEAAFPDETWATGVDFVYEPDNGAVEYYRSEYGTEPPVGFGGDPSREPPQPDGRQQQGRPHSDEEAATPERAGRVLDASGLGDRSEINAGSATPAPTDGQRRTSGQSLLAGEAADPDRLLTIPGQAMSRAQREALMALPAFSDDSDPLFGPAVWKYRDTNAHAAERAVAMEQVDVFGRPTGPVFHETDGAPADAAGRPMQEAVTGVAQDLDGAADKMGPQAAVATLQRAVNDLGDADVRAKTPKDGKQANRLWPRLAVDGQAGPRTSEALRLALHHAGQTRLSETMATRLATGR